jgi:hypothetical protein
MAVLEDMVDRLEVFASLDHDEGRAESAFPLVEEVQGKDAVPVVVVVVPDIQRIQDMDTEVEVPEIRVLEETSVVNMDEHIGYQFFQDNWFAPLFLFLLRNIESMMASRVDIEQAVVGKAEDAHVEMKLEVKGVEDHEEGLENVCRVPGNFARRKIDLVSIVVRKAAVEEAEGHSVAHNLSLAAPAVL